MTTTMTATEVTEIMIALQNAHDDTDDALIAKISQEHGVALIFQVTCHQGYSIHDQGSGPSLESWGCDTNYFRGDDDGGELYALPDGYHVAEMQYGGLGLYDRRGSYCNLYMQRNTVCISGPNGGNIGLKKL